METLSSGLGEVWTRSGRGSARPRRRSS